MSIVILTIDRAAISAQTIAGQPIQLPAYAGGYKVLYADAAQLDDEQLHTMWLGRVYNRKDPLLRYQRHDPPSIDKVGFQWHETAPAVDIERESALTNATGELTGHGRTVANSGLVIDLGANGPSGDLYARTDVDTAANLSIIAASLLGGAQYPANNIAWGFISADTGELVRKRLSKAQLTALTEAVATHRYKAGNTADVHIDAVEQLATTAEIRDYMNTTAQTGWPANPSVSLP